MSLESEILSGLKSPVPSFRVAALEKAEKDAASDQVLQALLDLKRSESDVELLFLIDHAASSIKKRLEKKQDPAPAGKDLRENEFFKAFPKEDPSGRLSLLSSLSAASLKRLASQAPRFLKEEANPLVAAGIIRTFGPEWPLEQFKDLTQNLGSKSLSLRLAALEVLVQRMPQELSRSLPKLLVSQDPRIRGLAIRGLAAIDLEEALAHHEYLLGSTNPNDRQIALENSFFFPFERIKARLFRYMARETDSVLLMKAGVLFAINPDIEVPYRLWELVEIASPEKTVILKSVANDACQALEKSGRLSPAEFAKYSFQLDEWVQQKYATRYVQYCVARLASETAPDPETESMIIRHAEHPFVKKVFEKAFDWPLSPYVKNRLREILNPSESHGSSATEEGKTPSGPLSPGRALNEEIRRIALLKNTDRKKARQEIADVLASEHAPPALLATALRTAVRLGLADFSDQAAELIHSSDPVLVPPAIEYLNQFHFERIYPFLRKFIKSSHPAIKSAALKAFRRDDPQQALSTLRSMLMDTNKEEQRAALASMIYFDFPLVRDLLYDYMTEVTDPELFTGALCLFAGNPDPESLYSLYKLERDVPPEEAKQVALIREQSEAFLVKSGILTTEEAAARNKTFPKQYAFEKERASSTPQPYSLRALQDFIGQPERRGLLQQLVSFEGALLLGIILIGGCVAGYLLGLDEWFGRSAVGTAKGTSKQVEGRVIGYDRESSGVILQLSDGKQVLVLPDKHGNLPGSSGGGLFKGRIVPVRIGQNGMLIGRFEGAE